MNNPILLAILKISLQPDNSVCNGCFDLFFFHELFNN